MMKKYLPVLAGALVLAGCATPNQVSDVNQILGMSAPATGSTFTRSLFKEYKAATRYEAKVEYEWNDASIFAAKGLEAAHGMAPTLAQTDAWGPLPAARQPVLAAARARLLADFESGSIARLPALSAHAQVSFDCWVEEEHEGNTDSSCEKDFRITEPKLRPMVKAKAEKIEKTFIVYFHFNKATITPAAEKVLEKVKAAQEQMKPTNIYVSGYTDTVGSPGYNMALSERRAKAVVSALNAMGVSATKFDVKGYGENNLAVHTPNNTRDAQNRRAEIYFTN